MFALIFSINFKFDTVLFNDAIRKRVVFTAVFKDVVIVMSLDKVKL